MSTTTVSLSIPCSCLPPRPLSRLLALQASNLRTINPMLSGALFLLPKMQYTEERTTPPVNCALQLVAEIFEFMVNAARHAIDETNFHVERIRQGRSDNCD